MKAIVCKTFGDPSGLVFEEIGSGAPGAGEVRIAVRAVGINFAELVQISGEFQIPAPSPLIPGFEASGEVVEVGPGVEEFQMGERVLAVMCYGAYAEEIVLPVAHVVRVPNGMDFETAAAVPVAYGAAYVSLIHRGRLKAGETLLVHGATGNVGSAAVEVGKRMGATVIAVAGDRETVKTSPDHIVDYRQEDIAERVLALTEGRGADVILDLVGGDAFGASMGCIAWEGRILTVGYASGVIPDVSLARVLVKNISIVGEDIAGYAARDVGPLNQALNTLVGWYEEGALKPVVSRTFPLAEATAALSALAGGTAGGKIVLTTYEAKNQGVRG